MITVAGDNFKARVRVRKCIKLRVIRVRVRATPAALLSDAIRPITLPARWGGARLATSDLAGRVRVSKVGL